MSNAATTIDDDDANDQTPAVTPPPAPGGAPAVQGRPTTDVMPPEALSARLKTENRRGQEAAKARLLQQFGATSAEELAAKIARAEELAKAEEARKQGEMSELDKLRAQLEQANKRAVELEGQLTRSREEQMSAQVDSTFRAIMSKYIDSSMHEPARLLLATEVKRRLREGDEDFTERDAERFIRRLAEKNPRFALQSALPAATPAAPATPPPPARRLVTTGAPPAKTAPTNTKTAPTSPDTYNGKTTLPGRPNSMTRAEFAAWAKERGLRV